MCFVSFFVNLQLAKRIFFKLLNEISPNSQAKHLQLAKNMQKNLHISIIFTTFAADFKIKSYGLRFRIQKTCR